MKFGRRCGSTSGPGTRRAPARRGLPQLGRRQGRHPAQGPQTRQRKPGPRPGSPALSLAIGHAPEDGRTPTAGPGVDPVAPATPPEAVAEVGGDTGEGGHTPVVAHIEVTGVTVGRTVEVTPGAAHTLDVGDQGQTPTTATQAGVGARAEDEATGEVKATEARTDGRGRITPPAAAPPGVEVTVTAVDTAEPQAIEGTEPQSGHCTTQKLLLLSESDSN